MNKIMTSALLLAAGTALSNAATVSYTSLFDNAEDWELSLGRSGRGSFSVTDGTLALVNSNWGQASAKYTFDSPISLSDGETLTFSMDLTFFSLDGSYTVALVGSESVFVFGKDYDENYISYGQSDNVSGRAYAFGTSLDNNGVNVTDQTRLGTEDVISSNSTLSISGSVENTGDSYTLTLSDGIATSAQIDLGAFDLSALIFFGDGANSTANITVSNVKISVIPEPSAFGLLAGVGALVLVASRRRRSK